MELEEKLRQELTENYLVRKEFHGVFVDRLQGEEVKARYFQTRTGVWFLLAGEGSPFDEDTVLNPQSESAQYLSEIVASSEED